MPIAFAALAATGALAGNSSALDASSLSASDRYDRCLELARQDPANALKAATRWRDQGGGGAAAHCSAVALVELKRYPEAAATLDRLGHENIGGTGRRADIFDQAGNAWLLARNGPNAVASFSAALALAPGNPDFLADRARAAAMLHDWKAAEDDLSAALAQDPNRADVLVLRASARKARGLAAEAPADLEKALSIVPDYPEALVERGTLKFEAGDVKGARADWQTAAARGAGTAAGEAAQQRLNALSKVKPK